MYTESGFPKWIWQIPIAAANVTLVEPQLLPKSHQSSVGHGAQLQLE